MIIKNSENSKYTEMIESRVSPIIQRIMRQKSITGLTIALVDDRGILLAKGYGFADEKERQPATPSTIYKIGSITKLFTGTAAMQLCERGLLDIDKPVLEYLPEFSIKSRGGEISRITPRNLMTHHSGLQADWYANYWNDDPHAFRQVIEYLQNSYLAFPPDTVFSYSNLATSLMGIIIERVSHLSYQEFMEQNILSPLRMADSAVDPKKVSSSLLSKAYARHREVEDPILRDAPAGAIFSNVQDMARFLSMVLAGGNLDGSAILGSKTLNEMLSVQNAVIPLDLGFQIGLNWMLGRPALSAAGRVCWHDGGSPHFFSMLIALPDEKLGAVVLSNSDGGMINVGVIADEMLRQAFAVKTEKDLPSSGGPTAGPQIEGDKPKQLPTGVFAAANGIVRITAYKESLRARMQGMQFTLKDSGEDWYSLRLLLLGFLPIKVASLESLRLSVRSVEGRRILGMEQYGFRAPFGVEYLPVNIPAAWAESLGEYRLTTRDRLPPFTSLRLKLNQGTLFLQATARKVGKMSLVLHPLTNGEAVVLGFGRTGGVTVELISQDGSRKLRFLGLEFEKP